MLWINAAIVSRHFDAPQVMWFTGQLQIGKDTDEINHWHKKN